MWVGVFAGLLGALAVGGEAGQAGAPPAQPASSAAKPGVVVTAPKAVERQRDFAQKSRSMSHSLAVDAPNLQLARWVRPICVRVGGMAPEQGAALIKRVTDTAKQLGLTVDKPGCLANLDVLMTDDPAWVIAQLKAKDYPFVNFTTAGAVSVTQREGFGDVGSASSNEKLKQFSASGEPIRAWHTVAWRATDGRPGSSPDPTLGFSHISTGGADEFFSVLVIIDSNKVEGLQFSQLADYVLMQAFTEPDPEHPPVAPSILNLFRDRAAGEPAQMALTDWDIGFLKGLYAARGNARAEVQRSEIARSIRDQLQRPKARQPN
jgi:hypothetical protein